MNSIHYTNNGLVEADMGIVLQMKMEAMTDLNVKD